MVEAISTPQALEEVVIEPVEKKQRTDLVEVTLADTTAVEETPEEVAESEVDLSVTLFRGMTSPLFDLVTEPSWAEILKPQFSEMYFHDITRFLHKEQNGKQSIFPPLRSVFSSLNACRFQDVKVVILGQDPYHDDGQAMGLSFSVPEGFKIPSSLLNIFKELETDLGIPRSRSGDLTSWAQQGILLLNAVLTVRAHQANSHEGKGWERFTDFIIKQISERNEHVVFMLWGKFAEKKAGRVDSKKHLILKSPHPSGLSASRGFFGSKHFSKANAYLAEKKRGEINWALP